MNKLSEMIEELCPEGVEWRKLGEVCEVLHPKIKIKSLNYLKTGKYPIIDQGQNYIGGYTNDDNVFEQGEYIIFGDHTCAVKYVDFPFAQGADGVKIIQAKEIIIPKFLYYAMSNIKLRAGYNRHWAKMRSFEIPLPPLAVQQAIVGILDKFDALITLLEAEKTAREKQYAYYRDKLLSFKQK